MKPVKKILLPILLLLVAAGLAAALFCYRATDEGLAALESDSVTVEKTDYGWRFDGPATDSALIFYPGAKVDAAAYAPLLHRLAESDMDVCLVNMPLHIALLGKDRADAVMAQHDYAHWYIGGHSLGGVMAARYASTHELDGVILLAAYPIDAIDEPMLLIYGTEDGVLNRARVAQSAQYGAVETFAIEGGNHALVGNYGEQAGDHPAQLSAAEQQRETVSLIEAWLA